TSSASSPPPRSSGSTTRGTWSTRASRTTPSATRWRRRPTSARSRPSPSWTRGGPAMGRIVVAGASLGGLRAAEQLRAAGHTGEIVVVGDEPHPPYNRPPLSKEALATEVTLDRVAFRMRPSVADVAWRLGTPVVRADLAARTVHLADGTEIRYDGLVVATGLRPRRLDAPGTGPSRHVVRTLDDAAALRERLRPGVRAAVVGAGFIGCEVAATARTLGADVTVVAPEEQPMLRPLGARLGAELRRRHEGRGVRFLLGRTVAR